MNVPIYHQGAAKWGSKKMSPSNFDLARYGCLVTSLSMAFKNYAIDTDPAKFTDALIKVNGFLPSGDLTWDGVERAFPQVSLLDRVNTTNVKDTNVMRMQIDVALDKIKQLVRYGQPTPVWVDAVDTDNRADHWVLVVDTDFTIHDPAHGDEINIKDRYGDPIKAIFGYAALYGPPIDFPVNGQPEIAQAVYKLIQAKKGINTQQNINEAIDILL